MALVLALALPLTAALAQSEQGTASQPRGVTRFDIPSQPLEEALMAFVGTSGFEVFVEHALATGQKSSELHGNYQAEDALRVLLSGTGLDIRQAADGAYTLVAPALEEPPVGRPPGWATDRDRFLFFAALQHAIRRSLCAQPEGQLARQRVALAVRIDQAGTVAEARVLGDEAGDAKYRGLLDLIDHLSIGRPPPAGLEQPITFVILPKSPDRTSDCAS